MEHFGAGHSGNSSRCPVAVVTGAAGLIGSVISSALATAGATVVGIDRAGAASAAALSYPADVADAVAMTEVAAEVAARLGRVDWLVHAAALTGRGGLPPGAERLTTVSPAVWDTVLRVNLTSGLLCTQAFLPLLRRSASARILLIGSIQGVVPTLGSGCYAVSKAASTALMRQLAAEVAPDGIRVNMVSPGPIAAAEEVAALVGEAPTPLGRYGTPEEVGAVVAALLGSAFDYLTGTEVPLDGGEHLRPRGEVARDPTTWMRLTEGTST